MATKPTSYADWCTGNPSGMAAPSTAQIASGWVPNEPPAAEVANFKANLVGQWIRYLDEQSSSTVLATTLDFSTRLIGGGAWSLSGTTLTWSDTAYIAIPSGNDADNTIAAGSVALPSGSIAYVVANMPFTTTATTTSGSKQLSQVIYGDQIRAGQSVTGTGIPAGAQVSTVSSDGQTVTLTQAATASATGVTLTFRSSGTLTPQVVASSAYVPNANAVVLARGLSSSVIVGVGSGQMLVRQGEAKALLGHGFVSSKMVTVGESAGLSANVPVYLSPGPTFIPSSTLGAAYLLNVNGNSGNQSTATFAGFTSSAASSGAQVEIVATGRLGGFSGLKTGSVYYAGTANGSISLSPPNVNNTYNEPVGIALSATEMLVAAGTAPVLYTTPTTSYSDTFDMGSLRSAGLGLNNEVFFRDVVYDNDASAANYTIAMRGATHAGRIVTLALNVPTAAGIGVTHRIKLYRPNATVFATYDLTPAASGVTSVDLPLAASSVSAGNSFYATLTVTSAGANSTTAVQCRLLMTVLYTY